MSHLESIAGVLQAIYPRAAPQQQEQKGNTVDEQLGDAAASDQQQQHEEQQKQQQQQEQQKQPEQHQGGGVDAGCVQQLEAPHGEPPDAYDERIVFITQRFDAASQEAASLHEYLQLAKQEAKESEELALAQADKEFTPAWRGSGLPSKPSHLRLIPAKAAAGALIDPARVTQHVAQVEAREVLSPPRVFEYDDDTVEPHHLQATGNLKVCQAISAAALATKKSLGLPGGPRPGAWSTLTAEELRPKLEAAEARQRALAVQMSPVQWELEQRIIKAMRQRLAFMRNPRYRDAPSNTSPVRAATTTATAYFDAACPPTIKGMQMQPKQPPPVLIMPVVTEPQEVIFGGYQPGMTYTQIVKVRNVSGVMTGIRLLPPASQYFHASLPRYPLADVNDIAPGMCAEVELHFTPDSLADYDDELIVLTQHGRLQLPLRGRRPPPVLTLPSIDAGDVLLGNVRRMQVHFTNLGGDGRFRIMPESLWPSGQVAPPPNQQQQPHQQLLAVPCSFEKASSHQTDTQPGDGQEYAAACWNSEFDIGASDSGRSGPTTTAVDGALVPFKLWPLLLDLPAGTAGSFTVEFAPSELGRQERGFVLVCDNCQVRRFSVTGRGTDVDVRLEDLDGRPWQLGGKDAAPGDVIGEVEGVGITPRQGCSGGGAAPIWMGEVVPGAAAVRTLRIRNATTLALPFRWEVGPLEDGKATTAAAGAAAGHSTRGSGFPAIAAGKAAAATGFCMDPPRGVMQPGELLTVALSFSPSVIGHAAAHARLVVDRSASALRQGIIGPAHEEEAAAAAVALEAAVAAATGSCGVAALEGSGLPGTGSSSGAEGCLGAGATCGNSGDVHCVTVVELVMQGHGSPASLELDPPAIKFPGALMRGQRVVAPLLLRNPTGAPVQFQFDAPDVSSQAAASQAGASSTGAAGGSTLLLSPSGGIVPPHGTFMVTVVLQPALAGQYRRVLSCTVQHGRQMTLPIAAEVQEAKVLPVAPEVVDFGLVRVGHTAVQEVELVNSSPYCDASWTVEQLPSENEGAAAAAAGDIGWSVQGGGAAVKRSSSSCLTAMLQRRVQTGVQLQLEPTNGKLPADGSCVVRLTCTALVPGSHRMVLRCVSGGGAHVVFVEATVTVVVPDVWVEPCRVSLGACYKGVPVRRTLHLRNMAQLPCSFSFDLWRQTASGQLLPVMAPRPAPRGGVTVVSSIATQSAAAKAMTGSSNGDALMTEERRVGEEISHGGLIGVSVAPRIGVLQPGQTVKIRLDVDPMAEGPARVFGMCSVDGMEAPRGFALQCVVEGLRVGYQIMDLAAWQAAGCPGRSSSGRASVRMQEAGNEPALDSETEEGDEDGGGADDRDAPLVMDFGVCTLGEHSSRVLLLRNKTSMAADFNAWVERHPPAVDQQLMWTARTLPRPGSGSAARASASSSSAHASGRSGSPGAASPGRSPLSSAFLSPPASPQLQLRSAGSCTAAAGGGASNLCGSISGPSWGNGSMTRGAASMDNRSVGSAGCGSSGAARRSQSPAVSASADARARSASPTGNTGMSAPWSAGARSSSGGGARLGPRGQQLRSPAGRNQRRVRLAADGGTLAPFIGIGTAGNKMMGTRREILEAAAVLGGGGRGKEWKGQGQGRWLALSLVPGAGRLAPHSSMALEVVAFSGMPGTYVDVLNVQVGDLPPRSITVVVRVAGSPLLLQKDRVIPLGLQQGADSSAVAYCSSSRPGQTGQSSSSSSSNGGTAGETSHSSIGPGRPLSSGVAATSRGGAAGGNGSGGHSSATGAAQPPAVPYGSQRVWGSSRGGLETHLEFGEVPVGAEQRRTFFVHNRSCMPMQLEWAVAEERQHGSCSKPVVQQVAVASGSEGTVTAAAMDAGGGSVEGDGGAEGGVVAPVDCAELRSGACHGQPEEQLAAQRDNQQQQGGEGQLQDQAPNIHHPQQQQQQQQQQAEDDKVHARVITVEPTSVVIKPGQLQSFCLRFSSSSVGRHQLQLQGTQCVVAEQQQLAARDSSQQQQQQQQQHQEEENEERMQQLPEEGGEVEAQPQSVQQHAEEQPRVLEVCTWLTGDPRRPLAVQLLGTFHPHAGAPPQKLPPLLVTAAATTSGCRLEMSNAADLLDWSCPGVVAAQGDAHPAFRRAVTMTNLAACPLAFSLAAEGPFDVVSAVPSVPQDPHLHAATLKATIGGGCGSGACAGRERLQQQTLGVVNGAGAAAADGGVICLPPRESVDVVLAFRPQCATQQQQEGGVQLRPPSWIANGGGSSSHRSRGGSGSPVKLASDITTMQAAASSSASSSARDGRSICSSKADGDGSSQEASYDDFTASGALVIHYINQEQQLVPLQVRVVHPATVCSSALLDFGAVHPKAPKQLEVIITNPTQLDAAWVVVQAGAPAVTVAAALSQAAAAARQARGRGGGVDGTRHLAPRDAASNGALLAGALTAAAVRSGVSSRTGGSNDGSGGMSGGLGSGGGGGDAAVRFGAFSVSPAVGVIPSRGLGMPCSQRVAVTYAPTDNKSEEVDIRVVVLGGRGCGLKLGGQGTYDEMREHQAQLKGL